MEVKGKVNKRGQATIFIIVAIVIVGLIVVLFAFRDKLFLRSSSGEFQPVFDYYEACVEAEARDAIQLAATQGGRIDTGTYVPGSYHAPFSSHLSFLGTQVPYWYYITGNGAVRENVPTKSDIERGISDYVESGLDNCDFTDFYAQGFDIQFGTPRVTTRINDANVNVNVLSGISVSREDSSATRSDYSVNVQSKLGTFYNAAIQVYNNEKQQAFLENYAIDVLRSYAPVDGVSVQCSPEIWRTGEVVEGLKEALENNFAAIRFGGDGYFSAQDIGEDARVLYFKDWNSKIEITPAGEDLMIAEPIGNQQGLGILGFCYVPYHFVYDWSFPALIQIYDGEEIFQFPLVVVIDDNVARQSLAPTIEDASESDICEFKVGSAKISTYDTSLNPVEARVSYKCFQQTCDLGTTSIENGIASLDAAVPICVNGEILAEAENYSVAKQLFSSNVETSADLILDREYPVKVAVKVDGKDFDGTSIVHFTSNDGTASAVIPESDSVSLKEGLYNISVLVYGNSSVVIPSSTKTECTTVSRTGILGLLGQTEDKCFEIVSPETRIDYALRGGGSGSEYLLASELEGGNIELFVSGLPQPRSLEQLQANFEIFTDYSVEVGFP